MASKRDLTSAKNRNAIITVLLSRLENEEFEDIKISDLCSDAHLSQASFYNYFPQKSDMLVYFIQMWSVEMSWNALCKRKLYGLKAIESIFRDTARSIMKHPHVISEIISFQAKWKPSAKWPVIGEADKIVAYPNYDGIEKIPAEGLDSLLLPNLQKAIEYGELPAGTPPMTLVISLASIFFGLPIILKHVPLDKVESIYLEQLSLLWDGAKKRFQ
jgi:hypothetical protein